MVLDLGIYQMKVVEISSDTIELFKLLKLENLVGSGAEAKLAISEGKVLVNGETETRKRRKLSSGDRIRFEEVTLCIKGP